MQKLLSMFILISQSKGSKSSKTAAASCLPLAALTGSSRERLREWCSLTYSRAHTWVVTRVWLNMSPFYELSRFDTCAKLRFYFRHCGK